jgi:hypothetical protein
MILVNVAEAMASTLLVTSVEATGLLALLVVLSALAITDSCRGDHAGTHPTRA